LNFTDKEIESEETRKLLSNPGIILRVKSYFLAFSRRQPAHEGS
jgi:hypothetical protein